MSRGVRVSLKVYTRSLRTVPKGEERSMRRVASVPQGEEERSLRRVSFFLPRMRGEDYAQSGASLPLPL